MSHVTDLVFIIPGVYQGDVYRRRFEDSFEAAHPGRGIAPNEEGGGKAMSCAVYMHGVSWINHEWIEEIRAMDWPEGTLLWLDAEGLMDQPSQIDVYRLGRGEGSK